MQLNLTEKGLRKMMEMGKSYRHALLNADVLDTFKVPSNLFFMTVVHVVTLQTCCRLTTCKPPCKRSRPVYYTAQFLCSSSDTL